MLKIIKKNQNNKKFNIELIYLAITILGSIFIILSCIHKNLWFDESYSIAIANHNFNEIWTIGSNDVHPVLYYFMLRIVKIIFNNNIVACRLFSCLPLITLSFLGYTHIRKDFGIKVGIIFSFLSLFWPTSIMYAGEIRMYTWAMLFVSIMTIYAYRILKYEYKIKNWIVFTVFCICSCYTHYYALILVFIENTMIFLPLMYKTLIKKQHIYKQKFITCIISAIIIILTYIPWIGCFLSQAKNVSKGFWIGFPNYFSVVKFLFTGMLDYNNGFQGIIANIFAIGALIYLIYLIVKNIKKENLIIYSLIILAMLTVIVSLASIIQPILYARYYLNYSGIFIFMLSLLLSKDSNKIVLIFCVITVTFSTILNINLIIENYDESNQIPMKYISEKMQIDDSLITDSNGFAGFATIAELNFKPEKSFFYNNQNWNVEEAYKAFGKTIINIEELKDYKGRLWIVSGGSYDLSNNIQENINNTEIIYKESFETKYKNQKFSIVLVNIY